MTMPERSTAASLADTRTGESRARAAVEGDTLQLREEELHARKRMVEAGEVQITTEVVSQERSIQVPITREEITVERRTADRRPADRPVGSQEVISVPFHGEEVTLAKRPVVYERIRVGTRTVQETRQVTGTVRREELAVDRVGDVRVEAIRGGAERLDEPGARDAR